MEGKHWLLSKLAETTLKKEKASEIAVRITKEYKLALKENIRDLVERLKAKSYRPKPVRDVPLYQKLVADDIIYELAC